MRLAAAGDVDADATAAIWKELRRASAAFGFAILRTPPWSATVRQRIHAAEWFLLKPVWLGKFGTSVQPPFLAAALGQCIRSSRIGRRCGRWWAWWWLVTWYRLPAARDRSVNAERRGIEGGLSVGGQSRGVPVPRPATSPRTASPSFAGRVHARRVGGCSGCVLSVCSQAVASGYSCRPVGYSVTEESRGKARRYVCIPTGGPRCPTAPGAPIASADLGAFC
jgi:hypothetical protein